MILLPLSEAIACFRQEVDKRLEEESRLRAPGRISKDTS